MDQKIIPLLKKARLFLAKYGLKGVKWDKLNEEGISMKEMIEQFNTPEELVETILQHERETFENLFKIFNVNGYNAIDVLLLVSKEINSNFFYINPSITLELKDLFPDIYAHHSRQREAYIKERMIMNINNGKAQGIYKKEIDAETTTNEMWKSLDEIYNAEELTGEGFSFTTIMESIMNLYIKTVANEDGLNYYKNRKQLYGVLGFGW